MGGASESEPFSEAASRSSAGVFKQDGKEAAQAVLGVGSGVAVDRHNAQLAGGSVADLRLCPPLGFFQVAALVAFACSRPGRRRSDAQGERWCCNQCGRWESGALSLGRDYVRVVPWEGLHPCNPFRGLGPKPGGDEGASGGGKKEKEKTAGASS